MGRRREPRVVLANNRGPFTLDGTRTFLVGRERVAVVDPGPNVDEHVRALSIALKGARDVCILLTHGHRDHSGAAFPLARALGARVLGPPTTSAPPPGGRVIVPEAEGGVAPLVEGDLLSTDEGELEVVEIPGHTRDHLAFHWKREAALFVGDLLLGRGDTTWLGEYPGCVADYLASLEKVRGLAPTCLYPAHGPPVNRPDAALDLFREHRLRRIREVEEAREAHPGASIEELVRAVYGKRLSERLGKAAGASVEVILHHLDQEGGGS